MSEERAEIAPAELGRIEFLGDNCELGFVLKRLGFEAGALFRWASITPESLLATLRGDFEGLYEFEALEPHRANMVRDRRYGTSWHSEMRSARVDGALRFNDDEPARRRIHAGEAAKRAYLLGKLRDHCERDDTIFVIKHNAGIAPSVLEGIHYQLYRRVRCPRFALLEVCADPARAGALEVVDRHLLRGYVPRFADYARADEGDDAAWRSVLRQALARDGRQAGAPERAPHQEPITLAFPWDGQAALHRAIPTDARGGVATLASGNEWCRVVDSGDFRLHARGLGDGASAIAWAGIMAPAGWELCLEARWAIPDSLPVRATLTVRSGRGAAWSGTCVFNDAGARILRLVVPPGCDLPLSAVFTVEPLRPLAPAERAVLDVCPVTVSAPVMVGTEAAAA